MYCILLAIRLPIVNKLELSWKFLVQVCLIAQVIMQIYLQKKHLKINFKNKTAPTEQFSRVPRLRLAAPSDWPVSKVSRTLESWI